MQNVTTKINIKVSQVRRLLFLIKIWEFVIHYTHHICNALIWYNPYVNVEISNKYLTYLRSIYVFSSILHVSVNRLLRPCAKKHYQCCQVLISLSELLLFPCQCAVSVYIYENKLYKMWCIADLYQHLTLILFRSNNAVFKLPNIYLIHKKDSERKIYYTTQTRELPGRLNNLYDPVNT